MLCRGWMTSIRSGPNCSKESLTMLVSGVFSVKLSLCAFGNEITMISFVTAKLVVCPIGISIATRVTNPSGEPIRGLAILFGSSSLVIIVMRLSSGSQLLSPAKAETIGLMATYATPSTKIPMGLSMSTPLSLSVPKSFTRPFAMSDVVVRVTVIVFW